MFTIEHKTSKGWEIVCETQSAELAFKTFKEVMDDGYWARLTYEPLD